MNSNAHRRLSVTGEDRLKGITSLRGKLPSMAIIMSIVEHT
jgi:hypothetical protein